MITPERKKKIRKKKARPRAQVKAAAPVVAAADTGAFRAAAPYKPPKERKSRPRLSARLSGLSLRELPLKAARPAMYFAGTFFFSFADCFSIPSPFGAALITVLAGQGESMLWPLLGAAAALGMRMIWGIPLDLWQYAGLALLMGCRGLLYQKKDWVLACASAAALLPRLAAAIFQGPPAAALLAGAGMLVGGAATPAIKQAAQVLRKGPHVLSMDDKLCCLMMGAALMCGAGYMAVAGLNIGLILGSLATVCLSHVSGSGAGAIGGILAGASLALGGQGGMEIVHLSLGGLVGGLVSGGKKRWRTGLVYLMAVALAALLTGTGHWTRVMLSAAVSTGVFLMLDERVLRWVKALVISAQPAEKQVENAYAGEMLRQWEQAIEEMAQNLPLPPEAGAAGHAERLMDFLCAGCQENCREEAGLPVKAMLETVWQESEKGEEALQAAVAELRGCGCIRLHLLAQAVEKTRREDEQEMARRAKAEYERDMIATHLTAMAASARRMADAARGETLGDLSGAAAIERTMKQISFPARLLYARRVEGRLQAAVEAETLAFTRWQPQRLIGALNTIAGLHMDVTLLEKNRMHLEERPPFHVESGSATICCRDTEDGRSNGDAVMTARFPLGRMLAALSDGMGHGQGAQKESQTTLELLKLCMAAGYTVEQALTAVNGMMLSATGGDKFATVDMMILDLWTGMAQMRKLGACTSFIVRGERVRAIEGAALPLGILERVSPISRQVRLFPEDMVVLLSDGAYDAFPPEQGAERAVLRNYYQDPQRMADALLRSALVAAGGVPKDDMTVLALRIAQEAEAVQREENVV